MMRYGESSHDAKEFDDDENDAEQIVITKDPIPHFPRRNANSSSLPGISFMVRVPNSMSRIELAANGPGIAYIPRTNGHDSTPRRTQTPQTGNVGFKLPQIGSGLFGQPQKKKKI